MSERLECELLQKVRYINTLTFTFKATYRRVLAVSRYSAVRLLTAEPEQHFVVRSGKSEA